MKRSVHLLQLSLVLSLLIGCSPTQTVTPIPSSEPIATATTQPVSNPNAELVAGQSNYLFYHPVLRKVVLVNGGPDHGKPADDPLELWAWDGAQWTLISADPNGPVWRNFHGAAYDSTRNVLVIFGGLQDASSRMEETWEWDGQTWTRFDVPGPGSREGTVMAYDEARGNVILYGGANERFEMLGDTWAWDGAAWTQVSTTGPSPRFPSAIVYDPERKKVLLFSGHLVDGNSAVFYDDFWEWDGTAWNEIVVEGDRPDSRNIATMIFHPIRKEVLMFGGGDGAFLSDLWSWDGSQWARILENGVPARSGLAGAYDPVRERLVVFGGVAKPGGKAVTDTWEWDGQTWRCVQGCK